MEKIVEPDSKEATTTVAEHRIRTSVQTEVEKVWKDSMEEENKITTNTVETLHSQVARLSEEVVDMKADTVEAQRVQWLRLSLTVQ